MTALLTDNLPLLAGAPDGIKKLRALILELAVRGKLVPQDPNDEPASELLKRIAEEKARLVAEGKIRKQKPLVEISEEERPFEVPASWAYARLSEIATKLTDGSHNPPKDAGSGFPMLSSRDVTTGKIRFDSPSRYLSADDFDAEDSRTRTQPGDVLLTIVASLGRSAVVPIDAPKFALQRSVAVIASGLYPEFLSNLLNSPVSLKYFDAHAKGTAQKGIYLGKLGEYVTPVPPLAEQHRVVAKVDELMALCDRLEAQQADAESAHAQLVQALLGSLTQAANAEDFAANWQRLAEHFHTLFTTEYSIDALKQTLLQLAVMGKLVPQESSDEPASGLLKRIAEEKGRLVNKGKIRKQKPLGKITEEDKPYELPAAWAWTRLGSQVLESGAGWSPSCEARPRDGDEWGVLKVSAVSWGIYRPEKNKALPPDLEARPEHEVAKGDFLLSRANTAELVARSVVVEETPERLMLSDKIVRLKLTSMCARRYMNLANSAPLARRYYSQVAGGTSSSMKNVSREQILNLPIALPPLAEQHRIVAKFDSLVAICDTLKRKINAATEKQIALLNAFMAKN